MASTELLYLNDFNVTSCDATVVATHPQQDGRVSIELDKTCFYPRGGGQDWDTGTIIANGQHAAVAEVRLDTEGTVQHMTVSRISWPVGTRVQCAVDPDRRAVNTRLHSAGHLVDMALATLRPEWVPGKGAHYPHMSFVEYTTSELPPADLAAEIETSIAAIQQKSYQNRIMFMPVANMAQYCRHIPPNIPANKPSRIVLYGPNFGVPCGGTHVANLAEVGRVTIGKVKAKKGIIKVSYAVEGIN